MTDPHSRDYPSLEVFPDCQPTRIATHLSNPIRFPDRHANSLPACFPDQPTHHRAEALRHLPSHRRHPSRHLHNPHHHPTRRPDADVDRRSRPRP
jgi:hypothetical protein